jgi:hypothetical protein
MSSKALCIGFALVLVGCNGSQAQPERRSSTYNVSRCGGAPSNWSPHGSEFGELMAHNTLEVGPASVRWNGIAISAATAKEYLGDMNQLNPHVNIQVVFDELTDCNVVQQTRALVSDNLHCGPTEACVEYSEPEWQGQQARHAVQ